MARSVATRGVGILLAVACAAPAHYSPASGSMMLARANDVTCSVEAPTGSHIGRSVCSTAQEREDKRLATQDSMRHPSTRMSSRGRAAVVDDFSIVVTHVHNP
jgi:hypothetical protein